MPGRNHPIPSQLCDMAAQRAAADGLADTAQPELTQLPILAREVAEAVSDLRSMQSGLKQKQHPRHRKRFVKTLTRLRNRFRRLLWTSPGAFRLYLRIATVWLRLKWPIIVQVCLLVGAGLLLAASLRWTIANWSEFQRIIDDLSSSFRIW